MGRDGYYMRRIRQPVCWSVNINVLYYLRGISDGGTDHSWNISLLGNSWGKTNFLGSPWGVLKAGCRSLSASPFPYKLMEGLEKRKKIAPRQRSETRNRLWDSSNKRYYDPLLYWKLQRSRTRHESTYRRDSLVSDNSGIMPLLLKEAFLRSRFTAIQKYVDLEVSSP